MKSHFGISTSHMRRAFTLVELLVAMALILFIMSIVSVVFGDATESFRIFRARAELSEKLRFITQTLRADLRANHFENGRRLSDPTFWSQGPPKAGYFRIEQASTGTATSTMEGDSIITSRPNASGADNKHVLMLTSFLDPTDFKGFHSISDSSITAFKTWLNGFSPSDSRLETGLSYNSPNAEIAWFLGGVTAGSNPAATPYDFATGRDFFTGKEYDRLEAPDIAPGLTLFKLYRRVWPMLPCEVPATTAAPTTFVPNTLDRLSVAPALLNDTRRNFNSLNNQFDPNVDVPTRRGLARFQSSNTYLGWQGSNFNTKIGGAAVDWALVADNVVSFSIEGWFEGRNGFSVLENPNGLGPAGPPVFSSPVGQKVFDTWCQRTIDANWGVNVDTASTNASGIPKWRDPTDPNRVPMPLDGTNGNPRRLLAVRITIRLYDLNTKSTWQATVIEYL